MSQACIYAENKKTNQEGISMQGRRTKTKKLYKVHGIDVDNDVNGKHSKIMCIQCKRKLDYHSRSKNVCSNVDINSDFWQSYDKNVEKNCDLCNHVLRMSNGLHKRRAPKKKTKTSPTAPHDFEPVSCSL